MAMAMMSAIASAFGAVANVREISAYERGSGLFPTHVTPGASGRRGKRYAASVRQHQRHAAKSRTKARA